jgi:CDP-glucose 4,6-dehydratase
MSHNVLVTGASGFTGSWLAQRLARGGAKVVTTLLDSDPASRFVRDGVIHEITHVQGTILDYKRLLQTFDDHGIDTVFHLAAVSLEGKAYGDPRTCFEVNIGGTYNLLECCRVRSDVVKRVIIASSDKVYGDSAILPYTENLPLLGINPYDVSKVCTDLIARCYFRTYGLPVTVARYANIYGGGDLNWSRLVPNTIRRLLRNEPPLIRSADHKSYKRDFLYINDQVDSYLALLEGMKRPEIHGLAFNFGMGYCISVEDVVARIQRIMGREDLRPIREVSNYGEIVEQHLSCERAHKLLGWKPSKPLDEGLAATVEWYTGYLRGTI